MSPTTSRQLARRIERGENFAARKPSAPQPKVATMTENAVIEAPAADQYTRAGLRTYRAALHTAWLHANAHEKPSEETLRVLMEGADAECVAAGLPSMFEAVSE